MVNRNMGYTTGASSLEVVWALVTPPSPIQGAKNFICVCIYSPPRSRLNEKLIEHLQFNLNNLTSVYPGAGIYIAGDINNLCCQKLRGTFPDLVNLVTSPTRGTRILDVIVTNMHCAYDKATIHPPIQPDVVGIGAESDHSVAIVQPNEDRSNRQN